MGSIWMTSHLNLHSVIYWNFKNCPIFFSQKYEKSWICFFEFRAEWQDTFILKFRRSCILFGVAFRSQKLAIWIDFLMWNWFGFVCISKFIFAQWRCNFLVQTKTLFFLLATRILNYVSTCHNSHSNKNQYQIRWCILF